VPFRVIHAYGLRPEDLESLKSALPGREIRALNDEVDRDRGY
jgi:hypothetical protein